MFQLLLEGIAAICRTLRFSNTYFQNVLFEWNVLAEDVNKSNTLGNSFTEDNEHFLLHYPFHDEMCKDLFCQLSEIPGLLLSAFLAPNPK